MFNPHKHLFVSIFMKDKELGDTDNYWCFIYCYKNIPPDNRGLILVSNNRSYEYKIIVTENTKHLIKTYKEVKTIIETGRLLNDQGLITPGFCIYEGDVNWG